MPAPTPERDHPLSEGLPIACQLKALDASERKRQKELLAVVRSKIQQTIELDRGFALDLPSDQATVLQLAEWVSLERRCCAFAEFTIEWLGGDIVRVRVTGNEGAKEVLAAEMGMSAGR